MTADEHDPLTSRLRDGRLHYEASLGPLKKKTKKNKKTKNQDILSRWRETQTQSVTNPPFTHTHTHTQSPTILQCIDLHTDTHVHSMVQIYRTSKAIAHSLLLLVQKR